jgi:two-component system LytT family response regulator
MKTINAIIIDDEAHARAALKGIIEENIDSVNILSEAKNLPEGVKLIKKYSPDIVFLDIEMPEYSGLEILDFFQNIEVNFKIIFVTAYTEYALNAFQLSAIDYIVKPIQLKDLKRALLKIEPTNNSKLEVLKSNLGIDTTKKIILNTNGVQEFLNIEEIINIKADGSYSDVILTDRKICITKRLAEFEILQTTGSFFRIHRSHIINIHHIKRLSRVDGYSVIMSNGQELPISKEKKSDLEKMIKLIKI